MEPAHLPKARPRKDKMKILVTGGLGFIGFRLVQNLIDQGHEVHALGRTQEPPKAKKN